MRRWGDGVMGDGAMRRRRAWSLLGHTAPRAKGWGYQGGAPLGPRGGANRGVQLLGGCSY